MQRRRFDASLTSYLSKKAVHVVMYKNQTEQ